jgi:hypothetical protein
MLNRARFPGIRVNAFIEERHQAELAMQRIVHGEIAILEMAHGQQVPLDPEESEGRTESIDIPIILGEVDAARVTDTIEAVALADDFVFIERVEVEISMIDCIETVIQCDQSADLIHTAERLDDLSHCVFGDFFKSGIHFVLLEMRVRIDLECPVQPPRDHNFSEQLSAEVFAEDVLSAPAPGVTRFDNNTATVMRHIWFFYFGFTDFGDIPHRTNCADVIDIYGTGPIIDINAIAQHGLQPKGFMEGAIHVEKRSSVFTFLQFGMTHGKCSERRPDGRQAIIRLAENHASQVTDAVVGNMPIDHIAKDSWTLEGFIDSKAYPTGKN